jgi:hypothetical protein
MQLEVRFALLVRVQIVGNLVVEDDIEEGAVHAHCAGLDWSTYFYLVSPIGM